MTLMNQTQSRAPRRPIRFRSTAVLMICCAVHFRTAAAPPPPGQLLAAQCYQCHGTNGRAVGGFESINGKPAKDMYEKLLEMSRRPVENIMDAQARAFTPAQLSLIANYLATIPGESTAATDR